MAITLKIMLQQWIGIHWESLDRLMSEYYDSLVRVIKKDSEFQTYAFKGFGKKVRGICIAFPDAFGISEGDLVEWQWSQGYSEPEYWHVSETNRQVWGTFAMVSKKRGKATLEARRTGEKKSVESQKSMVDRQNVSIQHLHPIINRASSSLFEHRHYPQAVFEAAKALERFIQEKTKLELSGRNLMQRVFKAKNPMIKINDGNSESKRNEREGFALLYEGIIPGIRNPKAHDLVSQTSRIKAFEYLAFLSLLARRADEGGLDSEKGAS
ncbi:MAG: TIGR02391 family protein [Nitrospinota bacterium]